jgi:hypothetical protein
MAGGQRLVGRLVPAGVGAALVTLLAGLALALSATSAQADPIYGVVPQDGALPAQDDLQLMPSGGITSIRTILPWSVVERTEGTYDWSGIDEIVRQTTANGIQPFPFLYGTPDWAAAKDNRKCADNVCAVYPPKSNATRDAFAAFSGAAAARYGPGGAFWTAPIAAGRQVGDFLGEQALVPCIPPLEPPLCDDPDPPPVPPPSPPGDPTPTPTPTPPLPDPGPLDPSLPPCQCTVAHPIRTWQIWNEQNSPKYFAPKVSVASYAKLLKGASAAIRAADPGADIILGGMWGPDSAKKVVQPVKKYLTRLYAIDGVAASFDSIALHPYASDSKPAAQALDVAHKVVKKAGDAKVGMWISEIGWASGGPAKNPYVKGKDGQAKVLGEALKSFAKKADSYNLRGVFWYSWRDKAGGDLICEWCGHAGLRAKNGTAKPAWDAFVKVAGS